MKYVKPFNLFHDLMKTKPLERWPLLSLDVGDKCVGLTVSDTNNKIVSPLRYETLLNTISFNKSNTDLMVSDFQSFMRVRAECALNLVGKWRFGGKNSKQPQNHHVAHTDNEYTLNLLKKELFGGENSKQPLNDYIINKIKPINIHIEASFLPLME
ncbi:hypothetical protein LOK49_LG01G02087, partial [Camellia lanceoleosa]